MPDTLDEYLSTEEAAQALGYSTEYVRRMIRKGKLQAEKKAGAWLVHRSAVAEYRRRVAGLSKNDPRRGRD